MNDDIYQDQQQIDCSHNRILKHNDFLIMMTKLLFEITTKFSQMSQLLSQLKFNQI